jgi:hypothetical protein
LNKRKKEKLFFYLNKERTKGIVSEVRNKKYVTMDYALSVDINKTFENLTEDVPCSRWIIKETPLINQMT